MNGWHDFVVLVLILISVGVHSFNCSSRHCIIPSKRTAVVQRLTLKAEDDDEINTARRSFLFNLASSASGLVLLGGVSQPALAGEIGRRITEAVTTSELGKSVRQSVIRGAQIMDQIDAQTERWSDRLHLGSARSQRDPRPGPQSFPPLCPLDVNIAAQMLDLSDRIFVKCTNITPKQLQEQVQLVTDTVLPSFVRSGLSLSDAGAPIQTAPQFNFASYVHYKAYSDLLTSSLSNPRRSFVEFQKAFEQQLGEQLLAFFESWSVPARSSSSNAEEALNHALQRIDALSALWVQAGLVSQVERSPIPADLLEDWRQEIDDLAFSIALDQDVTINAQVLLQEQGRRLYPSFLRCMIRAILQDALRPFSQTITTEDYYFDTDYNSDPEKFEVKQVLVNINIENAI
jgi:hypothetical protein